jgi:hypothetical protein
MSDDLEVAALVGEALQRAGIEYLVGGSVASSVLGDPRATGDIDFAVRLTERNIPELVRELGADFEVDTEMLVDAVRRRRSANFFYLPLATKIDVFVRGGPAFDESEFARKIAIAPEGRPFFIASREDNLLRKLVWYRAGGHVSELQWRDVRGMLRLAGEDIDAGYLRTWAKDLGVADLLERALEQARAD